MGSWEVVDKYLDRYAEPLSKIARNGPPKNYDAAVVVPIFSEETDTLQRLMGSVGEADGALVVLVVNAPPNSVDERLAQNEVFLDFVRRSGRCQFLGPGVEWLEAPLGVRGCDLLLLDVTDGPHRLRQKEGVGRARRIGLDFALALHRNGRLRSPLCGSTDADVWLPRGYFPALSDAGGGERRGPSVASGLLFPYRHRPADDARERAAMTELEISFRYYVLGLDFAGSPYAYHSLGSALAVSLPHYAAVRGVPNRQAGEDFHLLSKLSKLAPLKRLKNPTIEIQSRLSDRVPFGTGPSLTRALSEGRTPLRLYHPQAFDLLRLLLEGLTQAVLRGEPTDLRLSDALPPWTRARAESIWRAVKPLLASCPDEAHRLRRLHEKFDALRTLQFIHEAHKNGLNRVPIEQTFELAPFLQGGLDLNQKLELCVQKEQSLTRAAGLSSA